MEIKKIKSYCSKLIPKIYKTKNGFLLCWFGYELYYGDN